MNCPVCDEAMLILEYEDVEVDFCAECGGIWLDAGELEMLFGGREICERFLRGGARKHIGKEEARPCPVCGKKMLKEVTAGDPPVVFDECPKEHGAWYDKGELRRILSDGSLQEGGEQVRHWLRGLFDYHEPDASAPEP